MITEHKETKKIRLIMRRDKVRSRLLHLACSLLNRAVPLLLLLLPVITHDRLTNSVPTTMVRFKILFIPVQNNLHLRLHIYSQL